MLNTTERPTWVSYYLAQATVISTRADCRRRKVGAILVADDNRPLGQGYNGTDPGKPGCLSGACPRGLLSYTEQPAMGNYSNCISRHAEHNALLNIPGFNLFANRNDRVKLSLYRPTMFITDEPCGGCQSLMAATGVQKAVWPGGEIQL